jgi:Flp pilus assembly protein TadB
VEATGALGAGGSDAPHGTDRQAEEASAGSELRALRESQRTERDALQEELDEAVRSQSRATGWLITLGFGPATLLAILLALLVDGSRELAIGFALLGTAVMGVRAYRASRRVKEIRRALEDPMDGS